MYTVINHNTNETATCTAAELFDVLGFQPEDCEQFRTEEGVNLEALNDALYGIEVQEA